MSEMSLFKKFFELFSIQIRFLDKCLVSPEILISPLIPLLFLAAS